MARAVDASCVVYAKLADRRDACNTAPVLTNPTLSEVEMAKKIISDIDRVFKSVEVVIDSCWIWSGPLDKDGYARSIKIGSRSDGSRRFVRSHRFVYEQMVGPIPDGITIDHLCRNRCCLNPAHLEPVTGRENTQRGWRKNKTHCKHGHPLSGQNLIVNKNGSRNCRECRARLVREHYQRTGGAAQRKYQQKYREKRRREQSLRRSDIRVSG